jgi:hypothetical protein
MDAQQQRYRNRPVISPGGGGVNRNTGNPIVSSLSSGTPNANDATITWTTDIKADSQVFWGLTNAYGGASSPIMQDTSPYVTSHSVLITGLVTATTYHYKILTRTPGGTYSFSTDQTFITA